MKIYNYNPEYKYYTTTEFAYPSPLDPPGTWLIPANATTIEPPKCSKGFIQVFNGEKWEIVKDNRGIYYNTITGTKFFNYDFSTIPENSTKKIPPEVPENKKLKWLNNEWVLEDVYNNVLEDVYNNVVEINKSPEEKLNSLGLTIDELKNLLGI